VNKRNCGFAFIYFKELPKVKALRDVINYIFDQYDIDSDGKLNRKES